MRRLLPTLLVLALLVATAAAFALTERLKLVPSPIVAPRVTEAFSTRCACPTEAATVSFRLREPDRVTVEIVDANGDAVGKPVDDARRRAGRFTFSWAPADGVLPDGTYRARVRLARARRTIVIPNEMTLDTRRPRLVVERVAPTTFSPDGDRRADRVGATYSVSERSRVAVLVDGERAVESPPRRRGRIDWYGGDRGPGLYSLSLVATDLAGNRSPASPPRAIRLRFVTLSPRRVVTRSRARFRVGVSTDAPRYSWRLGRRRGTSGSAVLAVRAPARAGRYTLVASYRGHRDAIPVFVRRRR